MITATVGYPAPIDLQLDDGATDRYPRAYVFTDAGVSLGTVDLIHQDKGDYTGFFTFSSAGYFLVHFVTYLDAARTIEDVDYTRDTDLYRATITTGLSCEDLEAIADHVWDEPAEDHITPGSTGAYLETATHPEINLDCVDLSQIADAVWEEAKAGHTTPDTYGYYLDTTVSSRASEITAAAIKAKTDLLTFTGTDVHAAFSPTTQQDVADKVWDTAMASHTVAGSFGANANLIDEIKTAVDQINVETDPTQIAGAVWDATRLLHTNAGSFGEANQGVVSVARANNLDNLNATISSRAAAATAVSNTDLTLARIQNLDNLDIAVSTRASQVSMALGFAAGAKDATVAKDSTVAKESTLIAMNSTLVNIDNDTTLLESRLTATRAANLDKLDVNVSTRATQASVDNLSTIVAKDATVAKAAQLAALDAKIGTPVTTVSGDIAAIKTTVDAVSTAVNTSGVMVKPSEKADIADRVWDETLSDHLVAGTTGAKLDYLDNSTAVLTPADLSAIADSVWDESLVGHTSSGSAGANQNLIDEIANDTAALETRITAARATNLDNLDVAVSTRESEASAATRSSANFIEHNQTQTDIANLQLTTNSISTKIGSPITSLSGDIASVKADTTAIKSKTNNLPSDPASQSAVDSRFNTVDATTVATLNNTTLIKVKTDNLPADPASESSVVAIPTNPVLVTDPRLSRLDVNVSTRATPADLANLATKNDILLTEAAIIGGIDIVDAKVDQLPTNAELTAALAPIAKEITLQQVKAIVEAIQIAQLTAEQVWTYVTRSLTEPVTTDLDLAPLAKSTEVNAAKAEILDAIPKHDIDMTTAINPDTDEIEVQVWMDLDNATIEDPFNASISVFDGLGALIFSSPVSTDHTPQGVFRFIRGNASALLSRNKTYVVSATITHGTETLQKLKSFVVF
jgi:hypothetical protein